MKKVYSAPVVEVVPIAVNSVLMVSTKPNDGTLYGIILWDENAVDSEGFNIWQ